MGLNPVSPYGVTRKTYHSVTNDEFFKDKIGFSWGTTHDNYGAVKNKDGHFSKPIYDLEKGDHYFWICGRSGGYRLDKIHFFKEGVEGFTDDSEPSTPILKGE